MSRKSEEELTKKSFEVVLPLDKNFNSMEEDTLLENLKDVESEEDDEEGRPVCNTWNGKNHGLYVLGHVDNPFLRHVKAYQVPETVQVEFDPFSRADCNLKGEHPISDAFLVWSASERAEETSPVTSTLEETIVHSRHDVVTLSDSEDDANEKETSVPYCDAESDTDAEMIEYIKTLKEKKRSGLSRTGETLWYDEEHQTIRNLHANSVSITNYGNLKNQSQFGKKEILFDSLSVEEKRMLVNNGQQ